MCWPKGAECEGRAAFHRRSESRVTTILDKELKRRIAVDGVDYTVAIDAEGIRLIGIGKRRPEVELRWRELLSGEAAMAVALNASVSEKRQAPAKAAPRTSTNRRPR